MRFFTSTKSIRETTMKLPLPRCGLRCLLWHMPIIASHVALLYALEMSWFYMASHRRQLDDTNKVLITSSTYILGCLVDLATTAHALVWPVVSLISRGRVCWYGALHFLVSVGLGQLISYNRREGNILGIRGDNTIIWMSASSIATVWSMWKYHTSTGGGWH
jgi:hypothetical protein